MGWQVLTAAMALGSGISAASAQKKAGRVALAESKAQAAEMRRQKFDVALAATQQHQSRMEQFKELTEYNQAMNAYMGRSGRSISALSKKEEKSYGTDVTRLRLQEQREKDRLEKEASTTVARGRVSQDTYKTQARISLFDTATKIASLA